MLVLSVQNQINKIIDCISRTSISELKKRWKERKGQPGLLQSHYNGWDNPLDLAFSPSYSKTEWDNLLVPLCCHHLIATTFSPSPHCHLAPAIGTLPAQIRINVPKLGMVCVCVSVCLYKPACMPNNDSRLACLLRGGGLLQSKARKPSEKEYGLVGTFTSLKPGRLWKSEKKAQACSELSLQQVGWDGIFHSEVVVAR